LLELGLESIVFIYFIWSDSGFDVSNLDNETEKSLYFSLTLNDFSSPASSLTTFCKFSISFYAFLLFFL